MGTNFEHAGHFYNLVAHALMDVNASHGGCERRLRLILDELAEMMEEPSVEPESSAPHQQYDAATIRAVIARLEQGFGANSAPVFVIKHLFGGE